MKGGSCCKFENVGKGCHSVGIYHDSEKKSKIGYCGLLNNIYVFYTYHVFKHMDEIEVDGNTIECYDLDTFNDFLRDFLPESTIAKCISSRGKQRQATLVSIFSDENAKSLENGSYVSFCFNTTNECIFFAFDKMNDSITIFTLGNCKFTQNGNTIKYKPIFSNNTDDYHLASSNAEKLDTLASVNIQRYIEQLKESTKIIARLPSYLIPSELHSTIEPSTETKKSEKPSQPTQTHKNAKPLKKKQTKKKSPESNEAALFLELKIKRFLDMNDKITIDNVDDLIVVQDIIEKSSYGKCKILFNSCTFSDVPIVISDKVFEIRFAKCIGFPIIESSNIVNLTIIDCDDFFPERVASLRHLNSLILTNTRNVNFAGLENMMIETLKIIVCDIDNFDIASSWQLNMLDLIYSNIVTLPVLIKLKYLFYITDYPSINIENINSLDECSIFTPQQYTQRNACSIIMSKPLRRQILTENIALVKELTKNMTPMEKTEFGAESQRITYELLQKYGALSKYLFSVDLIFSYHLKKFVCPNVNLLNCQFMIADNKDEILESFKDIYKEF
uniref:Uncharacterized protein n=1 Tax=viral metagenome TaxID=1070528 RepID=A0A6C0HR77_9ZZZZ